MTTRSNNQKFTLADITGTAVADSEVGFSEICETVYKYICAEYRKNPNIEINLIGWSRGATIAVEVAHMLNKAGSMNVNFVGLFDPVDMAFFNWTSSSKPSNVKMLYSIQSTSKHALEWIFPPQKYNNEKRNKLYNKDGSASSHGDIGGVTENWRKPFEWMKKEAIKHGVPM